MTSKKWSVIILSVSKLIAKVPIHVEKCQYTNLKDRMPERIDLLKLERRFLLFRKSGRSTAFLDLCASPVIFRSYGAYIPSY